MIPVEIEFQQSELCPASIAQAAAATKIQALTTLAWQQSTAVGLDFSKARLLSICIRFVDQGESKALNQSYRGRDYPTNVLSFTTAMLDEAHCLHLGDLVICADCLVNEAGVQSKSVADHFLHLVLHGILHLIGYDHEIEADALEMESLEVALLKGVGVQDPYEVIVDEGERFEK